jgi:hypothetical protein
MTERRLAMDDYIIVKNGSSLMPGSYQDLDFAWQEALKLAKEYRYDSFAIYERIGEVQVEFNQVKNDEPD